MLSRIVLPRRFNNIRGAAGLPRLVHKRMGMEWPAAAGVVDDRGYCG